MKSLKKGILALGLTLGIIASVGGSVVFAASETFGHVNSYATSARSRVFTNTADARTFFATKGTVTVYSEYYYINVNNLNIGKMTRNDGGNNTYVASLAFTAPNNTRSVKIESSHVVYAFGDLWSASTKATY
jgi:hypothetical protein